MPNKVVEIAPDVIRIRQQSLFIRIANWISRIIIFALWIWFPMGLVIEPSIAYFRQADSQHFDLGKFVLFTFNTPLLLLAAWGIFYGLLLLIPSGYSDWRITRNGLFRTWRLILPLRQKKIDSAQIKGIALVKAAEQATTVPVRVALLLEGQTVARQFIFETSSKRENEALALAQKLSNWWGVPFEEQIAFNKLTIGEACVGTVLLAFYLIGGGLIGLWCGIFSVDRGLNGSLSGVLGILVLGCVWTITFGFFSSLFFSSNQLGNGRITPKGIFRKSNLRTARASFLPRIDIVHLLHVKPAYQYNSNGQLVDTYSQGLLYVVTYQQPTVLLLQAALNTSTVEHVKRILDLRCDALLRLEPFGDWKRQSLLMVDTTNRQCHILPLRPFLPFPKTDRKHWITYPFSFIEHIDFQTVQNGAKLTESPFGRFYYTYCIHITLGNGITLTTHHGVFTVAVKRPDPENQALKLVEATVAQLKSEIFGEQQEEEVLPKLIYAKR